MGAGLDANIGDSDTIRTEISASDATTRATVVDAETMATSTHSVSWAPRTLVGITPANVDNLFVMAEYCYSGFGFWGEDCNRIVSYARTARNSGMGPSMSWIDPGL